MTWALPSFVFRVTRVSYASDAETALCGIGGAMSGGRWHSRGNRIVYTSNSATLSLLERVVHADEWISERHPDRVMLKIKVPPITFIRFTADELASRDPNWQAEGNCLCRNLGDAWLGSKLGCALVVPSAANPLDFNILFNPELAEFEEVLRVNTSLDVTPLIPEERVVSLVRKSRGHGT